MLSVFITPWMKPTSIHCATSDACASTTRSKNARYGFSASAAVGWWRAIAWSARRRSSVAVAGHRRVLERADAHVARRDAREHRAGQHAPRAAMSSPVATTASARVVGMPSACIASPITYSRSIGPTAALPSPPRANGVRPEPLRCRSRRRRGRRRPRRAAARGRRRGAASSAPNWWPAYACATGVAPSGATLPARHATPACDRSAAGSTPSSRGELLVEREQPRRRGPARPATARTGPRARARRSRRRRTGGGRRRSCHRG